MLSPYFETHLRLPSTTPLSQTRQTRQGRGGGRVCTEAVLRGIPSNADNWLSFRNAITGEWRGSLCSFDSAGEKISLPHLYIPDAYKEWGMEMFDWQTHCSTNVRDGKAIHFIKKLYAATGCECDAIASEHRVERALKENQIDLSGSFSSSTLQRLDGNVQRASIEACFCQRSAGERKRLVLQLLHLNDAWKLERIDLYKERHLGPFGTEIDITDSGTRMQDVSSLEKTSLRKDTIANLQSMQRSLTDRSRVAMQEILDDPGSLYLLHDDTYVGFSSVLVSSFVLFGCQGFHFCVGGFVDDVHLLH